MSLSQADRQSFSLYIVQADAQIASIMQSQSQVATQIAKLQSIDTANMNLATPITALINGYQSEFQYLDGNVRSVITEQSIQDAANKKLRNFFFPNDTTTSVPSLSATNNIWTQISPFALNYAIGKNYSQSYPTISGEQGLINATLSLITSASAYQDIELTSGQQFTSGMSGVLQTYPAVVTLKTNIVSNINTIVSNLNSELTSIVSNDPNGTNQSQNNAAMANINNVVLPALNAWLANPDFNPVPGTVTTYAEFYAYDPSLLAPTKLHSTQLTVLQSALNSRLSFVNTRISQLNSILGSISQDLTNGNITASSGLYGKRYGLIALRLHALNGSLSQLVSFQGVTGAQGSIIASITQNKATYLSMVPTGVFQAAGNGTSSVNVSNANLFSIGDSVFISADNQLELQRAVKSINGNVIVLNDIIPPKYTPSTNARLYKDLT